MIKITALRKYVHENQTFDSIFLSELNALSVLFMMVSANLDAAYNTGGSSP